MFRLLLSVALSMWLLEAFAAPPVISSIEATDSTLRFQMTGKPLEEAHDLVVWQIPPCGTIEEETPKVVWRGRSGAEVLEIPRFDGQVDHLFGRFVVTKEGDTPGGTPRWVTRFSLSGDRDFAFPRPASIKGLQVQMVDDAIALGIKHAGINVALPLLLSGKSDSPHRLEVDGEAIYFSPQYVARLDSIMKPLTDAGVNVKAIFLNTKYGQQGGDPLVHPETRWDEAPTFSVAFNLTTPEARRRYRAALQFLAERYSREGAPHGWITGYIIGNEVQSHWMWYNRGTAQDEEVVDEYSAALRLADLAVRSVHSELRVYASFDHFWQAKMELPEGRAMPGRKLLDSLAERSRQEGDFPWGVAMHPYPENLFNPRFWDDTTAPLDFAAPRITLNNIEVLTAYLRRPELLCEGTPRSVTLSEQGFHTLDSDPQGTDGQALQAAAFARAYYKLKHLEGIESFLLHRHVDHADEGGLKLGLWTRRSDVPGSSPDQKKQLYEVFRRADTPDWQPAFEFAKPLVGIRDWHEALPQAIAP